MNNIAIKVENLTKIYPLYNSPKDMLKEALHPLRKKYHHDFFALKDVSFEIKKGETVGIIGKNGAGKSTLLKILTGVLTPTSGEVQVNGRISSLLELGTGFNPELTGMENIYFNATINGLTNKQITSKVDDIIAFADIGEFINQPVKTYSSGMFARLAFAVAINIDPDIFIVDEALSVGDFQFQQKCLRRMQMFSDAGKTIVFVSHDTNSLKVFCKRGILLSNGLIIKLGNITDVADFYFGLYAGNIAQKSDFLALNSDKVDIELDIISSNMLYGDGKATIKSIGIFDKNNNKTSLLQQNSKVTIKVLFKANEPIYNALVGIMFKDEHGVGIFGFNSHLIDPERLVDLIKEEQYLYTIEFTLPKLANKTYGLTVAIQSGNASAYLDHCWGDGLKAITLSSNSLIFQTGMTICLSPEDIIKNEIKNMKEIKL